MSYGHLSLKFYFWYGLQTVTNFTPYPDLFFGFLNNLALQAPAAKIPHFLFKKICEIRVYAGQNYDDCLQISI